MTRNVYICRVPTYMRYSPLYLIVTSSPQTWKSPSFTPHHNPQPHHSCPGTFRRLNPWAVSAGFTLRLGDFRGLTPPSLLRIPHRLPWWPATLVPTRPKPDYLQPVLAAQPLSRV